MLPLKSNEVKARIHLSAASAGSAEAKEPNVVIVITDDQGCGDLAFTGNPAIETPKIDKLCRQGTLLHKSHVDPACAPMPGWQTPQGMGTAVYDPTYGRVPPQKKEQAGER